MKSKYLTLLVLLVALTPLFSLALEVKRVIYYWNLHSPPEGLEGAKKIISELQPDMIWYSHWVVGFPMPPNSEMAYQIARKVGFNEDKALRFKAWVEREAYSLEHLKEQLEIAKGVLLCPCILGYSNFRRDYNFHPLTYEPISEKEMRRMLLDFGKWGIINPETGKIYTLEETQEEFLKHARRLGVNFSGRGIPDLSSEEFIDYTVSKVLALKRVGVRCVWYDLYFQLPAKLGKRYGYEHPMVISLYRGALKIMRETREKGLIVGTWITPLLLPYNEVPPLDFVTVTPSSEEVLAVKPDYERWRYFANVVRERAPGVSLIIIFDFAAWSDELPLPIFSQRLSPEQQAEFLAKLTKMAKRLSEETGINIVVAYPVHGPGLGAHPQHLAYGLYKLYDALAPEFNTYKAIKKLIIAYP